MMKTISAIATAGVLGIAAIAAPAPAQAGNGGAVAAGVVGGLAAGAIIGSAVAPHYGGPYAYSRCYNVRQRVLTNYGPRWRWTRVCD